MKSGWHKESRVMLLVAALSLALITGGDACARGGGGGGFSRQGPAAGGVFSGGGESSPASTRPAGSPTAAQLPADVRPPAGSRPPTGTPIGELPCEPQIMSSIGVTHYLCNSQFYVQAHGDSGLVYMPVSAPR